MKLYRGLLVLLCLLALGITGLRLSAPDLPTPQPLSIVRVSEGLQVSDLSTISDAQGGPDHGFGERSAFSVEVPDRDGGSLRTVTVGALPVHVRHHLQLDVAEFSGHVPSMALQSRTELKVPVPDGGRDVLHTGILAGGEPALQACVVGHGSDRIVAVHHEPLEQAIAARQAGGALRRLQQLLGLQPALRWECLLVTLSTTPAEDAYPALLRGWNALRFSAVPDAIR